MLHFILYIYQCAFNHYAKGYEHGYAKAMQDAEKVMRDVLGTGISDSVS